MFWYIVFIPYHFTHICRLPQNVSKVSLEIVKSGQSFGGGLRTTFRGNEAMTMEPNHTFPSAKKNVVLYFFRVFLVGNKVTLFHFLQNCF